MHTIAELIWGGVPQRFPKLRFVMVEGGIGWIASVLCSMDHTWKDHHRWMAPDLEAPPSFYLHRHFWATFEDNRPGILTRELLNVERLMWRSDYPTRRGLSLTPGSRSPMTLPGFQKQRCTKWLATTPLGYTA